MLLNVVFAAALISADPSPVIAPWDYEARLSAVEKELATAKRERAEIKAELAKCVCINPQASAPASVPQAAPVQYRKVCYSNGTCQLVPIQSSQPAAAEPYAAPPQQLIYYSSGGDCASGNCSSGGYSSGGSCSSGNCGNSGSRGRRHR